MYIHTYMYIYIYIYIYIYSCIRNHDSNLTRPLGDGRVVRVARLRLATCMLSIMRVHMYTPIYIYIYIYIFTHMYMCIYIYIYTYSTVHIHIYIYIYIYIYKASPRSSAWCARSWQHPTPFRMVC